MLVNVSVHDRRQTNQTFPNKKRRDVQHIRQFCRFVMLSNGQLLGLYA